MSLARTATSVLFRALLARISLLEVHGGRSLGSPRRGRRPPSYTARVSARKISPAKPFTVVSDATHPGRPRGRRSPSTPHLAPGGERTSPNRRRSRPERPKRQVSSSFPGTISVPGPLELAPQVLAASRQLEATSREETSSRCRGYKLNPLAEAAAGLLAALSRELYYRHPVATKLIDSS